MQGPELEYLEGAKSIETVLIIRNKDTGEENSAMWDNLTDPVYIISQNNLKIIEEKLVDRPEVLLPEDREIRGTEGTAIDGVTGQGIIDGWRAQQEKYTLEITVYGDPGILDLIEP